MADNEDEWIRRRAYSLWEEEGRPSGKHAEHWEKARQELAAFRADKPKRASRTSAAAAAKGSLASSSPAPKKAGSKGAKKPPKQD
ncbi:DUF2934 domain-containing protein [Pseudorhizobium endolithicum]|uniref:DUF2934 domain-containing protein n=1 Tax=Pseudorhizobium endolithicum TaxID=1191678 RepID=UPI00163BE0F4|nr:DUF2934 domain-containing protein [Pseudorhizobium endolithicum]